MKNHNSTKIEKYKFFITLRLYNSLNFCKNMILHVGTPNVIKFVRCNLQ